MIPKKIHYFWFGNGPKGEKEKKCIESWKRFCPDYEIIEWNESNVDLDMMPFIREAYDSKKYAFASDVLRLWALYNYGGVYFDTDVELLKPYDDLLECSAFIGFENNNYVNTGQCVGAEKGNPIIKEMLDYYLDKHYVNPDGSFSKLGCPIVNTLILENNGLVRNGQYQVVKDFVVYPAEYFNPYDNIVDKVSLTDNTYSIHWYANSWGSKRNPVVAKMIVYYHRLKRMLKK